MGQDTKDDCICQNTACPQFCDTGYYSPESMKTIYYDNHCRLYNDDGTKLYCRHGFPAGGWGKPLIPAPTFAFKHGMQGGVIGKFTN
jgi:hypothetical protein